MPRKLDNEYLRRLLDSWPDLALEYLFEYYKPKLLRQSEWKTQDASAAQDIVQEAITSLWLRKEWILSQSELIIENYLVSIIRNQSIRFYRRSQFRDSQHKKIERSIDEDSKVFDLGLEQDSTERDAIIWDLIAEFPSREKESLILKYKKELSTEEIASEMKITAKAVEKNITRAYKRLRQYRHLFE